MSIQPSDSSEGWIQAGPIALALVQPGDVISSYLGLAQSKRHTKTFGTCHHHHHSWLTFALMVTSCCTTQEVVTTHPLHVYRTSARITLLNGDTSRLGAAVLIKSLDGPKVAII